MWSSVSVSDESLLAGLASRDRAAATAVVRRFQARVYGPGPTIVRDQGAAQDGAPEALASFALASPGADPGEREFEVDDIERLRGALAGLPEEQRRAVVLAGLYGRTAKEVSELEGVPLGTAKTRIRTAMLRLRSALGVTG